MEQKASPAFVVGAVIVLVLFVGWCAYRSFGPQPEAPRTKAMLEWDAYMRGVAAYTHGDPSKLTKEDRDKISAKTDGFGVRSEVRKYAGLP
jgi:hypothetical protein